MRYIAFAFVLLLSQSLLAQPQSKNVTVESTDGNKLSILNTYPDSFPVISVVFKAERDGEPVWDLAIEDLSVYEDNDACPLVSLASISTRKAINISLILDHSGSMETDWSQFYVTNDQGNLVLSYDQDGNLTSAQDNGTPLDLAKASIKNFIGRFNLDKDNVGLIGFSTEIDVRVPLTKDTSLINSILDTIQPTNLTALYDAAYEGLQQLRGEDGISIEVLLTDGNDNSSSKGWADVIDLAIAEDIPVFVIGLGNVNVDTLSLIAEQTNGEFFHATKAQSLDSIYTRISRKILSFYDLRYHSVNTSSIDQTRELRLNFNVADEFVFSDTAAVKLPQEVILYLQEKERQRDYLIYGGIASLILITSGVLLARFRRREDDDKKEIVIRKVYPNPTSAVINVIHNAEGGFLVVRDLSGQELRRHEIKSVHESIDLGGLSGVYIVVLETDLGVSDPVKVVVQD
ncbi:MAG: VWA domain-containing protein [Bacteroidota bacterium]